MVERFGDHFRNYWPGVVAIITVAAMWGTITAQLSSISRDQGVMSARQEKMADKLDTIGEGLAATKVAVADVAANGNDLRDRVKALEARR